MHTVRPLPRRGSAALAAALAFLLVLAGILTAPPAQAAADDSTVSDATLTWGLNGYAQKGIFGPWTLKDFTGNVSQLVGSVSGGNQTEYTPSPENTSMPVSDPQKTPNAAKFTGGTGEVNPRTGEAHLSWIGSYTVNAYPAAFNAPNEIYSDPELTVDENGQGALSMNFVLGAGVDVSGNPTPAVDLGRVTLVTLSGVQVTATGFTVTPDYQGVTLDPAQLGGTQDTTCATGWGAWSPGFVYAVPASVHPHFYSTGCGGTQDLKPALPVQLAYTSASPVPTISVSQTIDLDREGETVTVTGSGFLPDAPGTSGTRPPLAGKFGGAYVIFGKFADAWKPSEGAPAAARAAGDIKWLVHAEDLATIGGEGRGGAVVAADGTFSVQLHVKKGFENEPASGNYGIYSYSGSGAKHAAFETFTPISFAPLATGLTFTTAPSGQATEGGLVTLRAKLDSPVAGSVTFSNAGKMLGTVAADASGAAALVVPSLPVGTHTLKAVFTPTDTATHAPSTATRVFTVMAKPVAAAGSLTWGFKQSFRSYVTGPIAHGSITTTGTGTAGGAFVFAQKAGGTFNGATGTSVYSGSVRFLGHGGVLDLRLANPVVRVDSASSATLLLSVNGGGSVPFAKLALASGIKSVTNGAVSYAGVPATLTAQGAAAFVHGGSQFYPAGTALDAVSFVIGSPSSGGDGGSTTVAAFTDDDDSVPATPPATTGITLETPVDEVTEGGDITITASGFESNETGIKVIIYSEPVILATDAAADAQGDVSWTGPLPTGLAGEHTLTLQGSVDRGIALTIAEAATTVMAGCVVTDASLGWGFKEAFRSYISGAIANGEWTVADGATYETPSFGWSANSGNYDPERGEGLIAFEGSVQFTGHGGVLSTTIANPQVRFDGGGEATLLLDVAGETRDGVAVDQREVDFASIDLASADSSEADGVHEFADAPVTLSAAGSAAFGTYETGTALDPVTLAFTTDDGCAAPAAPAGDQAAAPVAESESGPGWIIWATIAVVLAALTAAGIVIARRRTLG